MKVPEQLPTRRLCGRRSSSLLASAAAPTSTWLAVNFPPCPKTLQQSHCVKNTTYRTRTCTVHSLERVCGLGPGRRNVSGPHYDLHDVVQFVQVRPAAGAGAQGGGGVRGQALQQVVGPHLGGALHARQHGVQVVVGRVHV